MLNYNQNVRIHCIYGAMYSNICIFKYNALFKVILKDSIETM